MAYYNGKEWVSSLTSNTSTKSTMQQNMEKSSNPTSVKGYGGVASDGTYKRSTVSKSSTIAGKTVSGGSSKTYSGSTASTSSTASSGSSTKKTTIPSLINSSNKSSVPSASQTGMQKITTATPSIAVSTFSKLASGGSNASKSSSKTDTASTSTNTKTPTVTNANYGKGNIDLNSRPKIRNSDGTYSTVASVSFNIDGKEVLIPTVIKENGVWKRVDDKTALEHYQKTGEYLGIFDTVEEANAYAEQLHKEQEEQYSESDVKATDSTKTPNTSTTTEYKGLKKDWYDIAPLEFNADNYDIFQNKTHNYDERSDEIGYLDPYQVILVDNADGVYQYWDKFFNPENEESKKWYSEEEIYKATAEIANFYNDLKWLSMNDVLSENDKKIAEQKAEEAIELRNALYEMGKIWYQFSDENMIDVSENSELVKDYNLKMANYRASVGKLLRDAGADVREFDSDYLKKIFSGIGVENSSEEFINGTNLVTGQPIFSDAYFDKLKSDNRGVREEQDRVYSNGSQFFGNVSYSGTESLSEEKARLLEEYVTAYEELSVAESNLKYAKQQNDDLLYARDYYMLSSDEIDQSIVALQASIDTGNLDEASKKYAEDSIAYLNRRKDSEERQKQYATATDVYESMSEDDISKAVEMLGNLNAYSEEDIKNVFGDSLSTEILSYKGTEVSKLESEVKNIFDKITAGTDTPSDLVKLDELQKQIEVLKSAGKEEEKDVTQSVAYLALQAYQSQKALDELGEEFETAISSSSAGEAGQYLFQNYVDAYEKAKADFDYFDSLLGNNAISDIPPEIYAEFDSVEPKYIAKVNDALRSGDKTYIERMEEEHRKAAIEWYKTTQYEKYRIAKENAESKMNSMRILSTFDMSDDPERMSAYNMGKEIMSQIYSLVYNEDMEITDIMESVDSLGFTDGLTEDEKSLLLSYILHTPDVYLPDQTKIDEVYSLVQNSFTFPGSTQEKMKTILANGSDNFYYAVGKYGILEGLKYGLSLNNYINNVLHSRDVRELSDSVYKSYAFGDDLSFAIESMITPVISSITGNLSNSVEFAKNMINYSRYGDYVVSDSMTLGEWSQAITGNYRDTINKATNGANFLGLTVGDIYGAYASAVQSSVTMTLGTGLGEAFGLAGDALQTFAKAYTNIKFFASAANGAYTELINQGVPADKAVALSCMTGLNEALFEDLSFDKMYELMFSSNVAPTIAGRLLDGFIGMNIEGSEEYFTSVANTFAEWFVLKDKSELEKKVQEYRNINGITDEKDMAPYRSVYMDYVKSFVKDYVTGAISAGLSIAPNSIGQGARMKAEGRAFNASGVDNTISTTSLAGYEYILNLADKGSFDDESASKQKAIRRIATQLKDGKISKNNIDEYTGKLVELVDSVNEKFIDDFLMENYNTYVNSNFYGRTIDALENAARVAGIDLTSLQSAALSSVGRGDKVFLDNLGTAVKNAAGSEITDKDIVDIRKFVLGICTGSNTLDEETLDREIRSGCLSNYKARTAVFQFLMDNAGVQQGTENTTDTKNEEQSTEQAQNAEQAIDPNAEPNMGNGPVENRTVTYEPGKKISVSAPTYIPEDVKSNEYINTVVGFITDIWNNGKKIAIKSKLSFANTVKEARTEYWASVDRAVEAESSMNDNSAETEVPFDASFRSDTDHVTFGKNNSVSRSVFVDRRMNGFMGVDGKTKKAKVDEETANKEFDIFLMRAADKAFPVEGVSAHMMNYDFEKKQATESGRNIQKAKAEQEIDPNQPSNMTEGTVGNQTATVNSQPRDVTFTEAERVSPEIDPNQPSNMVDNAEVGEQTATVNSKPRNVTFVEAARIDVDAVNNAIDEVERFTADANKAIAVSEDKINREQAAVEAAQATKDEAEAVLSDEGSVSRTNAEIADAKDALAESNAEIDRAETAIKKEQENIAAVERGLSSKVTAVEEAIARAEKSVQTAKSSAEATNPELESVNANERKAKADLDKAEKRKIAADHGWENAENRLKVREKAAETARIKEEKAKQKAEEAKRAEQEAKNKADAAEKKAEEVETRNKATLETADQQSDEYKKAQKENEDALADLLSASDKFDDVRKKTAEAEAKARKAVEEAQKARQKVEEAKAEAQKAADNVTAAEEALNAAHTTAETLTTQSEEATGAAVAVLDEIAKEEERLAEAEARAEELLGAQTEITEETSEDTATPTLFATESSDRMLEISDATNDILSRMDTVKGEQEEADLLKEYDVLDERAKIEASTIAENEINNIVSYYSNDPASLIDVESDLRVQIESVRTARADSGMNESVAAILSRAETAALNNAIDNAKSTINNTGATNGQQSTDTGEVPNGNGRMDNTGGSTESQGQRTESESAGTAGTSRIVLSTSAVLSQVGVSPNSTSVLFDSGGKTIGDIRGSIALTKGQQDAVIQMRGLGIDRVIFTKGDLTNSNGVNFNGRTQQLVNGENVMFVSTESDLEWNQILDHESMHAMLSILEETDRRKFVSFLLELAFDGHDGLYDYMFNCMLPSYLGARLSKNNTDINSDYTVNVTDELIAYIDEEMLCDLYAGANRYKSFNFGMAHAYERLQFGHLLDQMGDNVRSMVYATGFKEYAASRLGTRGNVQAVNEETGEKRTPSINFENLLQDLSDVTAFNYDAAHYNRIMDPNITARVHNEVTKFGKMVVDERSEGSEKIKYRRLVELKPSEEYQGLSDDDLVDRYNKTLAVSNMNVHDKETIPSEYRKKPFESAKQWASRVTSAQQAATNEFPSLNAEYKARINEKEKEAKKKHEEEAKKKETKEEEPISKREDNNSETSTAEQKAENKSTAKKTKPDESVKSESTPQNTEQTKQQKTAETAKETSASENKRPSGYQNKKPGMQSAIDSKSRNSTKKHENVSIYSEEGKNRYDVSATVNAITHVVKEDFADDSTDAEEAWFDEWKYVEENYRLLSKKYKSDVDSLYDDAKEAAEMGRFEYTEEEYPYYREELNNLLKEHGYYISRFEQTDRDSIIAIVEKDQSKRQKYIDYVHDKNAFVNKSRVQTKQQQTAERAKEVRDSVKHPKVQTQTEKEETAAKQTSTVPTVTNVNRPEAIQKQIEGKDKPKWLKSLEAGKNRGQVEYEFQNDPVVKKEFAAFEHVLNGKNKDGTGIKYKAIFYKGHIFSGTENTIDGNKVKDITSRMDVFMRLFGPYAQNYHTTDNFFEKYAWVLEHESKFLSDPYSFSNAPFGTDSHFAMEYSYGGIYLADIGPDTTAFIGTMDYGNVIYPIFGLKHTGENDFTFSAAATSFVTNLRGLFESDSVPNIFNDESVARDFLGDEYYGRFSVATNENTESINDIGIASTATALGSEADVRVNDNGELLVASNDNTALYSVATWKNGGKDAMIDVLTKKGHTIDEIADLVSQVEDAADYLQLLASDMIEKEGYDTLANHLSAEIITNVKTGKQAISAFVNNGEYPVNIDLALICKKRVAYMNVMNALIEDGFFDTIEFDSTAIAKVNEILRNNGYETACLGCFVESRRLSFQEWADTIISEWNSQVKKRVPKATNVSNLGDIDIQSLTDDEILALHNEFESEGEKNDIGNHNLGGKVSVKTKMGRLLDRNIDAAKNGKPSLLGFLRTADLLTPDGLKRIRQLDPDLFSLIVSRYGANSPKIVQDYNPYNGEIANLTFQFAKYITNHAISGTKQYTDQAKEELRSKEPDEKKIKPKAAYQEAKAKWDEEVADRAVQLYLFSIGGARMQSFSDFMIENVFDYIQIFADLSAKELPMHGYTKEQICMRLFGMTGGKWNGSLISHVDESMGKEMAGLLDASEADSGNAIRVKYGGKDYAIGFDDYARHKLFVNSYIQSIGMKDILALQLDPRYADDIGSITIGLSDPHIVAMLDNPFFRMIIPYHSSGMNRFYAEAMKISMYNDYTDVQNTTVKQYFDVNMNPVTYQTLTGEKEKLNKDGSPKESKEKPKSQFKFNEDLQKTGNARTTAANYVEWCGQYHPIIKDGEIVGYETYNPKFYTIKDANGKSIVNHKNYYKLLEDFNTFNCITEAPSPQKAVQMIMPSENTRLSDQELNDYRERLRNTGVFLKQNGFDKNGKPIYVEDTAAIEKYVNRAQMTTKELIAEEIQNRADYEKQQKPKFESTVQEIKDSLSERPKLTKSEREKAKKEEKKQSKKSKKTANTGRNSLVSDKLDSEYISYVENGDMENAQRMVDEAAMNAGYTRKVYHGTKNGKFNVFKFGRAGIYTTPDESLANLYGDVMSLYAKEVENELVVDANGSPFFRIPKENINIDFDRYPLHRGKDAYSTENISQIAFKEGYDSVVINDVYDPPSIETEYDKLSTDIVFKESSQVKSADPVTYDDNGDVIPLSQRFNSGTGDIRYSVSAQDNDIQNAYDVGDENSLSDVASGRFSTSVTEDTQFRAINQLTGEEEYIPNVLEYLEDQIKRGEYTITYKAFVIMEDGLLRAPMEVYQQDKDGNWFLSHGLTPGVWEMSVGNPNNPKIVKNQGFYNDYDGKEYWHYGLNKTENGGRVPAAYNPYQHSSDMVINDQFATYFKRPNIVVYQCIIPNSELDHHYMAVGAKDPVGMTDWKTGEFADKLEQTQRHTYLSRFLMPVRALTDQEVAEKYREYIDKENKTREELAVPYNVVNEQLKDALEDAGVVIDYNGTNGRQKDEEGERVKSLKNTVKTEVTKALGKRNPQIKETTDTIIDRVLSERDSYIDSAIEDDKKNNQEKWETTKEKQKKYTSQITREARKEFWKNKGIAVGKDAYRSYVDQTDPPGMKEFVSSLVSKDSGRYSVSSHDIIPDLEEALRKEVTENSRPRPGMSRARVLQNEINRLKRINEDETSVDEVEGNPTVRDTYDYSPTDYDVFSLSDKSENNYAPIFYSHMANVVDSIKQDKLGAGSVVNYLKGKGVKNEEIKWSGIEQFLDGKKSVTKAELQEFVKNSDLKIEEVIRGEKDDALNKLRTELGKYYDFTNDEIDRCFDAFGKFNLSLFKKIVSNLVSEDEIYPEEAYAALASAEKFYYKYGLTYKRWSLYKTKGGKNYRELLFKLPKSSYTNSSMENHWDTTGVLAHARVDDMTTKNGNSVLFVEEIQSDWHNEGDKKGYVAEEEVAKNRIKHGLEAKEEYIRQRFDDFYQPGYYDQFIAWKEGRRGGEQFRDQFTSDEWDEVKGRFYDINHEWANENIDDFELLSTYRPVYDAPFKKSYSEFVLKRLLRMAAEENYDKLGWTTAQQQVERWSDEYAEGYRIEYDQDIPGFLKKYGKQWGAQVGKEKLDNGETVWTMPITDSMKDDVLYKGQPKYSISTDPVDTLDRNFNGVLIDELGNETFDPEFANKFATSSSVTSDNTIYRTSDNTTFAPMDDGSIMTIPFDPNSEDVKYTERLKNNDNGTAERTYTIPRAKGNGNDGYRIDQQNAGLRRGQTGLSQIAEKSQNVSGRNTPSVLQESKQQTQKPKGIIPAKYSTTQNVDDQVKADADEIVSKMAKDSTERIIASYLKTNLDPVGLENEINRLFGNDPSQTVSIVEQVRNAAAFAPLTDAERANINQTLDDLIQKYGQKERGEKPRNDKILPRKISDGKNVSKFQRTMAETNPTWLNDLLDRRLLTEEIGAYTPTSNKRDMDKARATIDAIGYRKAIEYWEGIFNAGELPSSYDMALAETILRDATDQGLVKEAMALSAQLAMLAPRMGQATQAFRMLKYIGPVGNLYYAQQLVRRLNAEYAKRINDPKNKMKPIVLNDTLAMQVMAANTREELDTAIEALMRDIANQIPATWRDKANAWRYMSMLLNPKTHIKNFTGNAFFLPVIQVKDLVLYGLQHSGLGRGVKTRKYFRIDRNSNVYKYALGDFDGMVDTMLGKSAKMIDKSTILQYRDNMWNHKAMDRIWKKLDQVNSEGLFSLFGKSDVLGLESGDKVFLKKYYVETLAQYLAAHGVETEDAIRRLDTTRDGRKLLNAARAHAVREAQRNTYRDASRTANLLYRLKTSAPGGVGLLFEGLYPFTTTPINVTKRGVIDYSVIGLVRGISDYARAVRSDQSSDTESMIAQALDEISAGFTGTALIAIGMLLAHFGILRGTGSDDDDEKALETAMGYQDFSINAFGYNFTIDWMSPGAIPLLVGEALYKNLSKKSEDEGVPIMDTIEDSIVAMLDPIMNMTMLDGLNSVLDTASYADDNKKFAAVTIQMALSYAGQFIPTIGGQIARTIDPYRRSAYTDKDSNVPSDVQYFLQNTVLGKIPFASMSRMKYTDVFGRTEKTNRLQLAVENFLSPGYLNKIDDSPVFQELSRVYQSTKDSRVIPEKQDKFIKYQDGEDTVKYNLDKNEYFDLNSAAGQMGYDLMNRLFNSEEYNSASDIDQASMIAEVYSYAEKVNKKQIKPEFDYSKSDSWIDEANGFGVIDYITIHSNLTDARKKNSTLYDYVLNNDSWTVDQQALILADAYNPPVTVPSGKTGYNFVLTDADQERAEELYREYAPSVLQRLRDSGKLNTDDKEEQMAIWEDYNSEIKEKVNNTLTAEMAATDPVVKRAKSSGLSYDDAVGVYWNDKELRSDYAKAAEYFVDRAPSPSEYNDPDKPGYVISFSKEQQYEMDRRIEKEIEKRLSAKEKSAEYARLSDAEKKSATIDVLVNSAEYVRSVYAKELKASGEANEYREDFTSMSWANFYKLATSGELSTQEQVNAIVDKYDATANTTINGHELSYQQQQTRVAYLTNVVNNGGYTTKGKYIKSFREFWASNPDEAAYKKWRESLATATVNEMVRRYPELK